MGSEANNLLPILFLGVPYYKYSRGLSNILYYSLGFLIMIIVED